MTRAKDISKILTDADISGNIDVDGVTNLDVVDIDGAVDMASTLTVTGVTRVGTSSASAAGNLIVGDTSGGVIALTKRADAYSAGDVIGSLDWYTEDASLDGPNLTARIVATAHGVSGDDANLAFFTKSATGGANATESMRITLDGKVGIGTNDPHQMLGIESASNPAISIVDTTNNVECLIYADDSIVHMGSLTNHPLVFRQNNTERMRIDVNGGVSLHANGVNIVGSSDTGGFFFANGAYFAASVINDTVAYFNRVSSDGDVIAIRHNGTSEGTISISGTTVSYNAFSGSHWSRFTDNSKPTILKGTIIETIDEMCDWYQAKFTIPATTKKDDEGNEIQDAPEQTMKDSIALPSGKKVGDTISHTYKGVTYDDVVIIKEDDNKHTKCKISDTADSKRVYGVFADWDNDDDTVNDMYVTAVGTHVVRINGSITVSAGDLLASNGDGTAKVQNDDIIRSKTIGKVLTNIKQETYSDDSYTVPCALYCG